ncbi:hypothetical protein GGI17_005912 [Coemansia sp. S146]|nr:hypothetical protein GGI17_005912 [Coemansia sp. S146]
MILTFLALACALYVFATHLGLYGVLLGAILLLAWAWWELRELPRPIVRHIENRELAAVCFNIVDSVENPLFERLLRWMLPHSICIKRFQHRVLLRDYMSVDCWKYTDYHTFVEWLLWRALPDNFLVRHFLHWFFHDMSRDGVCPVDDIETQMRPTCFGRFDYLSWFSSTEFYLYLTIYDKLAIHDSNDARLAEEATHKADDTST